MLRYHKCSSDFYLSQVSILPLLGQRLDYGTCRSCTLSTDSYPSFLSPYSFIVSFSILLFCNFRYFRFRKFYFIWPQLFFFYKPYIISISLKEPGPFVPNNPFGAFDPVLFVIPIFVYFLFKFFLSNIIRQPQSVALHVVLFGILNTRKSANNIFLVCHCFRTLFVIIWCKHSKLIIYLSRPIISSLYVTALFFIFQKSF